MYDFHPVFSSFPFVLLTVCGALEIAALRSGREDLRTAAGWNLAFAAAGIVLAFFSGYLAAPYAARRFAVPEAAIDLHHLVGKAVLFLGIACVGVRLIARRARFHASIFYRAYLLLLSALWLVSAAAGYLGGELVFSHGAGVSGGELRAPPM